MADPSTINASIQTLLDKGYSMSDIDAIRYSVPKGDNRRATVLANAARSYGPKAQPQAAPPSAPKPIKPAPPPQRLSKDGDNLKIKKRSKRKSKLASQGTGSLRIDPSTGPSVGGSGSAQSGGVNI